MSTIKSSAENLTLNADGANNDIKFQSNGSEVASIDQAGSLVLSGNLTSLGIDDNADATAITIDSAENVLIGKTTSGTQNTADGIELRNAGYMFLTKSADAPLYVNRRSSDGNIAEFRKDGTTVGKIEVSSSGMSVFLGGTAAANALDDYEEGTWTPTVNGGSWTLAIQKATYTKVGNLVTLLIYIDIGTNSGDGTRFEIGGMPFATLGNGYGQGSADTNTLGHVGLRTQSAASYMIVKKANNNTWVNENEIDGGHLIGALIYHVA
jgi:hypothetical protein